MKLVALSATVATLTTDAANECAWTPPLDRRALSAPVRVLAQAPRTGLVAREEQDQAGHRICEVQGAQSPTPDTYDLSASGRRKLSDALDQASSVQQALALLRNATVALYNHPTDQALHAAALRAVGKARECLLSDGLPQQTAQTAQPAAAGNLFAEQAAALDLAEFSIHFPRLYREQRMWRLKIHWLAGNMVASA